MTADRYAAAARAANTRTAYSSQWARFCAWSERRGSASMPAAAGDVAEYLGSMADGGRRPATIDLALAAIADHHRRAGHPSPRGHELVREVMAGIRRTLGVAHDQVEPVLPDDLRRAVAALPDSLAGRRDRAVLLVGFAGAFRRSEIVAVDVEHLSFSAQGVVILVPRSKRDQEGEGKRKALPFGRDLCPVEALRRWLDEAQIRSGPVFRSVNRWGTIGGRLSSGAIAGIVKAAAAAGGLPPGRRAGHSLRAGFCTAAAGAGKSPRAIQDQTGHATVRSLEPYIRAARAFEDNAAEGLL